MLVHILGGIVILGLGYATWKQIPAEDPEIIAIRAEYGQAEFD